MSGPVVWDSVCLSAASHRDGVSKVLEVMPRYEVYGWSELIFLSSFPAHLPAGIAAWSQGLGWFGLLQNAQGTVKHQVLQLGSNTT